MATADFAHLGIIIIIFKSVDRQGRLHLIYFVSHTIKTTFIQGIDLPLSKDCRNSCQLQGPIE